MPLSQDQVNRAQSWLNAKGVRAECHACGRNNWAVGDIVAAPTYSAGGIAIGGPSVPMLQVICANCAYVRLFAAVPVGLAS